MDDKVLIPKCILENTFHLSLNANDFFGYACAEAVELDVIDLKWVIPITVKYGQDGLNACMSYIEDSLPIDERRGGNFENALRELRELKPIIYSKLDEWDNIFLRKVSSGEITKASRDEQKGRKPSV